MEPKAIPMELKFWAAALTQTCKQKETKKIILIYHIYHYKEMMGTLQKVLCSNPGVGDMPSHSN